jgi:hypothetical protein
MLLEEAGAHIDGKGLLNTPQQMLMNESGVLPKFAKGKKVMSPEDMKAELFVQDTAPKQPTSVHPALAKAWNNFFK